MGINITIKDLPEEVSNILREQAKINHRSLNGEIKQILETHVKLKSRDKSEILSRIDMLRETTPKLNISDEELTNWKNWGRS